MLDLVPDDVAAEALNGGTTEFLCETVIPEDGGILTVIGKVILDGTEYRIGDFWRSGKPGVGKSMGVMAAMSNGTGAIMRLVTDHALAGRIMTVFKESGEALVDGAMFPIAKSFGDGRVGLRVASWRKGGNPIVSIVAIIDSIEAKWVATAIGFRSGGAEKVIGVDSSMSKPVDSIISEILRFHHIPRS